MEIKHGKLTVVGDIEMLPEGVMDKLIAAFDETYLKIWERFGEGEPFDITYSIESKYTGVAYTRGGKHVGLNPEWMVKHPEDIDCMTHELIHVAQHYPKYDFAWVVEGLADYGRDMFGVNNEAAKWKLPCGYHGEKMTAGYRSTAAFFKFIEANYCKDAINIMHNALRNQTFTLDTFKEQMGTSLEDLWNAYMKAAEQ